MTLEEVKSSIASLTGHEPYRLLLQHLEATTLGTLNKLAICVNDSEVLNFARLYQAQCECLRVLKNTPESLVKELEIAQIEADSAGVGDEYEYANALPRNRANQLKSIETEVKKKKEFKN